MKLVMTILVKDEKDIIKENLLYHLACGVDYILAIDNNSTDGTTEKLKDFEKHGFLKYYRENGIYHQSKWVTSLARYASQELKADWVINNDADEFWYHSSFNLKNVFNSVPSSFPIVRATRHNMLFDERVQNGKFYDQMIIRRKKSINPIGKPLPSKVCCRGNNNLNVFAGSHFIKHPAGDAVYKSDIEIFHYPFRSYEQLKRKVVNIGSAYEAIPQICEETGRQPGETMRTLYENWKKDPKFLKDLFNTFRVPKPKFSDMIRRKNFIKDIRLKILLSKIEDYDSIQPKLN